MTTMSSFAPSAAVPAATASNQKAIASCITPASAPISSVTQTTRRPFAASSTIATMFLAMPSSCIKPSTNTRQLFADQHIADPPPAEHSAHGHSTREAVANAPDDGGVGAKRMRAHGRQRRLGFIGRRDDQDLAFVGEIERVETEDLAERLDLF